MNVRESLQHVARVGRRLLIGIIVLYVVTSFTVGGTILAETMFYSLAAAWCLFVFVLLRNNLSRSLQIFELVAWNTVLTLLLAEMGLRAYGLWANHSLMLNDTLDAYRLVPGEDYGAGLRGNSLGFPGREVNSEKTPGVFRIAALGDSFAVGPAVPYSENYLTLLEQALPNVEVHNFGVSAAGPREYLAILQHHVPLVRPDMVLLSFFVGNDVTESLATPRNLDPRQHATYLVLTRAWRVERERRRADSDDSDERLRIPPLSEQAFREVEARRLAVCVNPPPPGLEKKWRRTFGYLREITEQCRRDGTPLGIVLIPDEFQVNPEVFAAALRDSGYNSEDLDLQAPQRRIRTWCDAHDIACLDLLPAFRDAEDAYAPRDTHWNVRGNRLAAEQIASWLPEKFTGSATVLRQTPTP